MKNNKWKKYLAMGLIVTILPFPQMFEPLKASAGNIPVTSQMKIDLLDAQGTPFSKETFGYAVLNAENKDKMVSLTLDFSLLDKHPEISKTPEVSATPAVSKTPEASATPIASKTPEAIATPEVSKTPVASAMPVVTATPEALATPEVTVVPEASESPEALKTPEALETPGVLKTPDTVTPAVTDIPDAEHKLSDPVFELYMADTDNMEEFNSDPVQIQPDSEKSENAEQKENVKPATGQKNHIQTDNDLKDNTQENTKENILPENQNEEIKFDLIFSDFFKISNDINQGNIYCINDNTDDSDEIGGAYTLSETADGKVKLSAWVSVPEYREKKWNGTLSFQLGLAKENDSFTIQWNEGMIDGKEKNVYERTPLKGRIVAMSEPEKLPSESKSTEIDIKSCLSNVSDPAVKKYAQIYKSAKMNLVTSRGSRKIRVEVKAELSDEYLNKGFEELLNHYDEALHHDFESYIKNPDNYAAAGLDELRMPFLFGDTFNTITGQTIQTALTLEDSTSPEADDFGYYKLEVVQSGLVKMNCILQNILYTKTGAKMEFAYELDCTKDIAANEIYTFVEKDGKISCGENQKVIVDGDPAGPGEYTIDKKVLQSSQNSPYVSYMITVKSYDEGGLDKALLQDILPDIEGTDTQALMVSRVFLKTDREDRKEITKGGVQDTGSYYLSKDQDSGNDSLYYYFPAGGNATRAVLEVEMMLTPTAMLSMNQSGQEIVFTNRSKLTIPGSKPKIYEKESDPVKKQFNMFTKSGKQCETDASKMEWNIKINAFFSGSPQVWLVDTLDPAAHSYLKDEAVTFDVTVKNQDGTSDSEPTRTSILKYVHDKPAGVTDNSFSKVNIDALNAYSYSAGNANAICYDADDGSMVMAVRINDYLSSAGKDKIEQTLTITYLTQLAPAGGSSTDLIQNSADLRWQYQGGEGPGWAPDFDFSLDKEVGIKRSGVTKRTGTKGYDQKTQTQSWWFDINSIKADLGKIVIEEDFSGTGSEQFLPSTDQLVCKIVHVNSVKTGNPITEGMVIPEGNAGSVFPYFEIDASGKKLDIHLGNVTKDDNYIVELETLVSGAVTCMPNPDGSDQNVHVTNTAKIKDELGNPTGDDAVAEAVIPNTLITKEALGSYDYKNNELLWKVLANPNSLVIKDGIITEELPEYLQLKRLKKVRYGDEVLDAGTGNLLSSIPGIGNKVQTSLKLSSASAWIQVERISAAKGEAYRISLTDGSNVLELEKPLELEFATELSKDYLNLAFKQKDPSSSIYKDIIADGKLSTSFVNKAGLSGSILDSSNQMSGYLIDQDKVFATAIHKVETKPFEKKGVYDPNKPGRIKWSVIINQAGGEIGGLKLKDTLINDKMELNKAPDSYGLYQTEVASDGTLTKGTEETGAVTITPENGNLEATIPAAPNQHTYLLEFETYLLDSVKLADMTNQITLEGADGSKLSSNTAVPTGADSFNSNDYAMAKDAPILMLDKFSSSKNASGAYMIKLAETKFTIREQEYDPVNGKWVEAPGADKIKETNSNGRQIFVNFEKGKLYKITETEAPKGYVAGEPFYIYWMKDVLEADDPTKDKDMKDDTGNQIAPERIIKVSNSYFKQQPVYNDPMKGSENGSVKFIKKEDQNVPLPGAEFTLTHTQGLVKTQTVTSTADGTVEFTNVDPGTYELKETKVPKSYLIASDTMKVVKEGENYKILDSKGNELTKESGSYQVKNELAETSVKIRKKNQNESLLSDVIFSVERYGDAAVPEPSGTDYVPYPLDRPMAGKVNQVKTDLNGMADLGGFIYGTYRITEEPSALVLPGEKKQWFLQISVSDNKPVATWYESDPEAVSGLIGTALTKKSDGTWLKEIINRFKYGYLQIEKVAGSKKTDGTYELAKENGNLIYVKDAVFEVFAMDQITKLPDQTLTLKSGAVPVLTLKTDANGAFVYRDADGKYQDAVSKEYKNLLTGEYAVREKSAPGGYLPCTELFGVKITWNESLNKPEMSIVYNITDNSHQYFANEICRAGVRLTKVDSVDRTQKLNGAVFVIYDTGNPDTADDDRAAAVLTEKDAAPGEYVLSGQAPQGIILETLNEQGLSYLKENTSGVPELLSGSYYLEEKTPPAGYEPLEKPISFTINSSAEVIIKNPVNNGFQEFINQKGRKTLQVQKNILTGDESQIPADTEQKALDGFRFILSGTPDMPGDIFAVRTLTTDSAGKTEFKDIPYGSYTLREEERLEGDGRKGIYQLAESVSLIISKDGIRAEGKELIQDTQTGNYELSLTNLLKRGSASAGTLAVTEGYEVPLTGAVLQIYKDAAATIPVLDAEGKPVTAISDQNGNTVFKSLPYGTYYVKELHIPDTFKPDQTVKKIILVKEHDGENISTADPFKNEIYKAQASITKRDSADPLGTNISGALFEIYAKDSKPMNQLVAYLSEAGTTGEYCLINQQGGNVLTTVLGKENLPCYIETGGKAYLTAGTYYAKEVKQPEYYQKDENSYSFKVDASVDGTVIKLSNGNSPGIFENVRETSDVTLTKVYKIQDDATEISYGLGGAEFTLYKDSACTLAYMVEKEGGKVPLVVKSGDGSADSFPGSIRIFDLPPGVYYLKETAFPAGFETPSAVPVYRIQTDGTRTEPVITDRDDPDSKPVTEIENTPSSDTQDTLLEITLRGNDGRILANASFAVYRDGILVSKTQTNSSGKLRMRGILPGIYTIRQLSSAEGYVPDQTQKELTVEAGREYELEVINHKPKQEPAAEGSESGGNGSDSGTSSSGNEVSAVKALGKTPKKEVSSEHEVVPLPGILPKTGGMTDNLLPALLSFLLIGAGIIRRKHGKKYDTGYMIAGVVLLVFIMVPLLLEYQTEKSIKASLMQQIKNQQTIEQENEAGFTVADSENNDQKDSVGTELMNTQENGIGLLSIPGIKLEVPVREGVTNKALKTAVGHVPGTALPGEDSGNCAIAGHRNYSFGRFFNRLEEVKNGDLITMTMLDGKTYYYKVTETMVVEPEDVEVLEQSEDKELTLITCTPMYIATHRFIVKATPLEEL